MAPRFLILASMGLFLASGFSLRGFNECGQVHSTAYLVLYLLHLVYCSLACYEFRNTLLTLIGEQYQKMITSGDIGMAAAVTPEMIGDSSNDFYVYDSKSELKNSFLTSEAFVYPLSNIFVKLNKYEQLLKVSSVFIPMIILSLFCKIIYIWILGRWLRERECVHLFGSLSGGLRVLLVLVSICGDNLPFFFLYYNFVYLLEVGRG